MGTLEIYRDVRNPINLVEMMSNVFLSNFHLLNLDIIEYVITNSLMFM